MVEFLKKMTEWMLEKEAEMAKKCAIPLSDIEKQIKTVEEKKEKLQKECEENQKELDKILTKLKWMHSEETKCQTNKGK